MPFSALLGSAPVSLIFTLILPSQSMSHYSSTTCDELSFTKKLTFQIVDVDFGATVLLGRDWQQICHKNKTRPAMMAMVKSSRALIPDEADHLSKLHGLLKDQTLGWKRNRIHRKINYDNLLLAWEKRYP
ncbi:hypothetical protein GALMADRAFT_277841 [Galerina marginata CBS 339.88]|uniref:Uncharacterized protein n=1 Tax=Galerina marginata (strain CBS 339.88) TaxID=685588 RepID=A0A067TAV6_GALM3|nr:hypothetical protein GALMADRAFT_277841 [Galerina marginata CBS 339.88]